MQKEKECVGTISGIYRFPVKSFGGESLEAAEAAQLGWHGLEGDRRYAFVKLQNGSGFPWLTARELPDMVRFHARMTDPGNLRTSSVTVRTPDGAEMDIREPALVTKLEELSGKKLHLLQNWVGIYDAADISLITETTIASVGSLASSAVTPRQFRPNLLVRTNDEGGFPEEKWLGGTLVLGDRADSARFRVIRKDKRCGIVGVNPDTGEMNRAVPQAINSARKNNAGVYGTVTFPGCLSVGDPVYFVKG